MVTCQIFAFLVNGNISKCSAFFSLTVGHHSWKYSKYCGKPRSCLMQTKKDLTVDVSLLVKCEVCKPIKHLWTHVWHNTLVSHCVQMHLCILRSVQVCLHLLLYPPIWILPPLPGEKFFAVNVRWGRRCCGCLCILCTHVWFGGGGPGEMADIWWKECNADYIPIGLRLEAAQQQYWHRENGGKRMQRETERSMQTEADKQYGESEGRNWIQWQRVHGRKNTKCSHSFTLAILWIQILGFPP